MSLSDSLAKRMTAMILVGFVALSSINASAQAKVDPLKGIAKATVLTVYSNTGVSPNGVSEGRLQTLIELKIRDAGLRILTQEENGSDPDLNPYIFGRLSTLETKNQAGKSIGFAYRIDLSARIFGDSPVNRARVPMELWVDSTMGVTSAESAYSGVEQALNELIDSFLNAWLKANPKR